MAGFKKSIIIVEDEPDTAEMLAEMMRLNGYQVCKTFGGRAAMALIAQEKPDAVLLDMMMPDVPGLEVLRFMRRNPHLSDIPVVMISGMTLPSDIKSGMDAGAYDYLVKPVDYEDLVHVVEKAIKSSDPCFGHL